MLKLYKKKEVLKRSKMFSYDQKIKTKGDKRTYFYKECDIENDVIIISNCHSDDNDTQHERYWINFDRIETLPKDVISYKLNQKVRYGNEDVVLYFKQYNSDYTKILVSTEILVGGVDYKETWEDTHMIHGDYKTRKGSR